ncbi:MAG: hypothetical protein IID37_02050 [Planctomycetes bacterium]|nr:hypothetical protein [Planctomycetota bacterium]
MARSTAPAELLGLKQTTRGSRMETTGIEHRAGGDHIEGVASSSVVRSV